MKKGIFRQYRLLHKLLKGDGFGYNPNRYECFLIDTEIKNSK